jgi:hypothetical protein
MMWLWFRGSGCISTPGVVRGTTNMPFVHITKRMSVGRDNEIVGAVNPTFGPDAVEDRTGPRVVHGDLVTDPARDVHVAVRSHIHPVRPFSTEPRPTGRPSSALNGSDFLAAAGDATASDPIAMAAITMRMLTHLLRSEPARSCRY